jgi:hypothetical protein
VNTCGHLCCEIAHNRYHSHTTAPAECDHCPDAAAEIDGLADIVTSVIDRVAPEISGLPTDPDVLLDHVVDLTTRVHERARTDPAIQQLSPRRRRTVLAARVGLGLAFPERVT